MKTNYYTHNIIVICESAKKKNMYNKKLYTFLKVLRKEWDVDV